MITDSNQVCFVKMIGRRVQEEAFIYKILLFRNNKNCHFRVETMLTFQPMIKLIKFSLVVKLLEGGQKVNGYSFGI